MRTIALLSALAAALTLAACGPSSQQTADKAKAEAAKAAEATKEAAKATVDAAKDATKAATEATKEAAGAAVGAAKDAAAGAADATKEAADKAAARHQGSCGQGCRCHQGSRGQGCRRRQGSRRAEEVTRSPGTRQDGRRSPGGRLLFRGRAAAAGAFECLRREAPDPARQRLPLLPVLLGTRARHVEDARAVTRAIDVDLRVAQVADDRKAAGLRGTRPAPRRCACGRRSASRRGRSAVRRPSPPCTRRSCAGSGRSPPCRTPKASAGSAPRRRAAPRRAAGRRAGPPGCRRRSSRSPCVPERRQAPAGSSGRAPGRRPSQKLADCWGSSSAMATRCRLPARNPATFVASVVLPQPPLGLAMRRVCTRVTCWL